MEDLDAVADITPEELDKLNELIRLHCSKRSNISVTALGDFRVRVYHDDGLLLVTLHEQKTVDSWATTIAECLQPPKSTTKETHGR